MDHFRKNGYHTLGTGKIMHNGERQEWIHYQNDADYSPLAHREGKNIAHPDIPAPFRDEFEAKVVPAPKRISIPVAVAGS